MSKTAATPREKSKLATKAVTPQAGNISLATDTTNDEDDGLFVDVDSLQVNGSYINKMFLVTKNEDWHWIQKSTFKYFLDFHVK